MNDSTNGLAPEEGIEMFLEDLDADAGTVDSTVRAYRSILQYFEEFCADREIDDLVTLDAAALRKWKHARRNHKNDLPDGERLSPKTLYDDLYMTRRFVRWLAQMDVVPTRLVNQIGTIQLDEEDEVSYNYLDDKVAEAVVEYYEAAAPGSIHHALMMLMWRTSMRLCEVYALDVSDVKTASADPDATGPFIRVRHRPDTGTRIKNGTSSERKVAIDHRLKDVLDRYVEYHRPDVEDDHGREPLFASEHGRRSKSNLREHIYEATQPCKIGNECPHGRDPRGCDAAVRRNDASKCPSVSSPHAVRKGAITHWRAQGVDRSEIAERADVKPETIEKHYDHRSETERMEQRREFFV